MRKIIYHIASTLDGFISAKDGSTPGFAMQGPHVDEYLAQLKADYDTVLMGKNTYTPAIAAGLVPGQAVYPHLRNIVFSNSLQIDPEAPAGGPVQAMWLKMLGFDPDNPPQGSFELVRDGAIDFVTALKAEAGLDIYLCGGGTFAGTLLEAGLIDELLLKLNPVVYGEGIRLFEGFEGVLTTELLDSKFYDNGVGLLRYRLS